MPESRFEYREYVDMRVIAYQKGTEWYIFSYSNNCLGQLAVVLGEYASNPDLRFTQHDAEYLSSEVSARMARDDLGHDG